MQLNCMHHYLPLVLQCPWKLVQGPRPGIAAQPPLTTKTSATQFQLGYDPDLCWHCRCDTFFLASCVMDEAQLAPGGSKGCDISHRGGAPGFIQVQESGVLTWADYIGNMTFTTLGACLPVEVPTAGH